MKVELELSGSELTLLYLATGNEDAGRIVTALAREYARLNPPEKKPRKRGRELEAQLAPIRLPDVCPSCGMSAKGLPSGFHGMNCPEAEPVQEDK